MILTNQENLPLSLAMWLAHDPYVYNPDPNSFSATEILKPIRSIVLSERVPPSETSDVSARIAARLGQAIHDSIESVWRLPPTIRKALLASLNIPERVADNIRINPTIQKPGHHNIYIEWQMQKQLDNYKVTGKPDFVQEGVLEDMKSTATYSYIKQSSASKFIQQGSIYRWLDPKIITADYMRINYIFTDWSSGKAKWDKNYPSSRILSQKYDLMSLPETELFIRERINLIIKNRPLAQEQLPLCTAEELWQDDPVFKFYIDPAKRSRSTKNFENASDAYAFKAKKGKGIVVEVPGKAKRCNYCPAIAICKQASDLAKADLLG